MKPKSRKFSRLLSTPRAWRQKQLEDHMTAVGPAAISTLAGEINAQPLFSALTSALTFAAFSLFTLIRKITRCHAG